MTSFAGQHSSWRTDLVGHPVATGYSRVPGFLRYFYARTLLRDRTYISLPSELLKL